MDAAPASGPRTGDRLGRYTFLDRLGTGGMAEVWRAEDAELARVIAVKLVRSDRLATEAARDRLRREAQALARLNHPNVVTVYDVGRIDDIDFIAMELARGTLRQWLAEASRSRAEVIDVLIRIARGIAAAHRAGILHRDIKPENVLVATTGEVKVSDFGVAGDLTAAGTGDRLATDPSIAGTPAYLAPEIVLGRPPDARADQFSFCVMAWEMLFGVRPFAAPATAEESLPTLAGHLASVMRGDVVHGAGPRAPELEAVLRRGLSVDPAARHPDLESLAALLARAGRPRRWPRRIAIAAPAVALASVASVIAVMAPRWRAERRESLPALAPARPSLRVEHARILTPHDGCEEFPSFTPDGKTVIFDGALGDDYVLFALDLATGSTRQLTHVRGWDYASTLSPDGTRLAFLRATDETGTFVAPLVAPDDAKLVARGKGMPAWCPDGEAVWAGPDHAMARHDLRTGVVTRTVTPPEGLLITHLVELGDGRVVVSLGDKANQGSRGIGLFAPDDRFRLLSEDNFDEVLVPLPGDDAILVSRWTTNSARELMRLSLGDGRAEGVGAADVQASKGLALSADGTRAVWSTCGVVYEIAVLDQMASGRSAPRKVTGGKWVDTHPAAIPGTGLLVVRSNRGGVPALWVLDPTATTSPRQIAAPGLDPRFPDVSPDGRLVAFTDAAQGLYVVPVDGSAEARQVTSDGVGSAPRFSRDGTRLYFDTTAGVASVPVEGGTSRLVVEGATGVAPSPSTEDLLVLDAASRTPQIVRPDGTRRRLSAELPPAAYSRLRVSPDGKKAALVRNTNEIIELDVASGRVLRRHQTHNDEVESLTYGPGGELYVALYAWQGDLWIADVELR